MISRLEGQLLRDFADSPDEVSGESDRSGHKDHAESLNHSPLQFLPRLQDLEEVSLISSNEDIMEFTWPIPPFKGLRKLVLHRLERESWSGNVDDIAKVLIVSPEITSLGLSLMPEEGLVNDLLRKLINYYHSNRGTQPFLKLSHLHLGLGFLPVKPGWSFPEDGYLNQLTNLQALTELCLDNWSVVPEHFSIPDYEIHASLFSKATRLKKLSVERFSSDILELIQLLENSTSGPINLDEIEVARYFETLKTDDEEFSNEFGEKRLYSVPQEGIGFYWRKLSYGSRSTNAPSKTTEHLLQNFISHCSEIQELSIPMIQEQLQVFKTHVMPQTKKLHTLMIPRGHVADLQVPESSRSERGQDGKRRKLDSSYQEMEQEHEMQRVDLAKDLFETNRGMVQQDPKITPLRYIGIGIHVYCCLLSVPSLWQAGVVFSAEQTASNGSKMMQDFQIIKLSSDQAREFDAVRRLDEETINFF